MICTNWEGISQRSGIEGSDIRRGKNNLKVIHLWEEGNSGKKFRCKGNWEKNHPTNDSTLQVQQEARSMGVECRTPEFGKYYASWQLFIPGKSDVKQQPYPHPKLGGQ